MRLDTPWSQHLAFPIARDYHSGLFAVLAAFIQLLAALLDYWAGE
jgi:hypothetical protein